MLLCANNCRGHNYVVLEKLAARRVLGAVLSLAMMLSLFMWNGVEAKAAIVENAAVSEVEKYDSGFLKSFKLDYHVGSPSWGAGSGEADSRVAVQTRQFTESDFTDVGNYARTYNYADWPASPADCGFVAWSSVGTFTRPATGNDHSITITIDDEFLRCFSNEMVEEILARPDVTVVVNFTDKDVNYSFTIPAGKAPTDGQEWYGYYYLGSAYGWTLVENVM